MSFAVDIAKYASTIDKTINQSVRAVRLESVKLVTQKMPVDTGQAKGSLDASINSYSTGYGGIDKSKKGEYANALGKASSVIAAKTD